MSEPEDFLSRWSRLKRESGAEPSVGSENGVTDRLPVIATPPAVDLTDLPPVESIVADSDVRLFLQSGVPEELTRAALRSAWTADPAIRGFIGIADNQWDFNGEGTIPGFGSLEAADYAVNVVTQSLGSVDTGAIEALAPAEAKAQLLAAAPAARFSVVDEVVHSHFSIHANAIAPKESPATSLDPQVKRTHGGALPK